MLRHVENSGSFPSVTLITCKLDRVTVTARDESVMIGAASRTEIKRKRGSENVNLTLIIENWRNDQNATVIVCQVGHIQSHEISCLHSLHLSQEPFCK